jgi:putative DNA primase/helicase
MPQFKIYIGTNNKPRFDSEEDGKAIWRRVILVPFESLFKDAESEDWDDDLVSQGKMFKKDEAFLGRLQKNMEGLLNWLVKGSIKYYGSPEKVPRKLLEATKEYKKSCNTFYVWLDENYCKTNDPGDVVLADDMLAHWKQENRVRENDRAIQTRIGNALKEWNIIKERKMIDGKRDYCYSNLKKKEE